MTAASPHCTPVMSLPVTQEIPGFRTLLTLREQNHMETWLGGREGGSHPSSLTHHPSSFPPEYNHLNVFFVPLCV